MKQFLRNKSRNEAFRRLIDLLKPLLGGARFKRLFGWTPVVGRVSVRLPEGQRLALKAGPDDEIATELYFGGVEEFEPETTRLFLHLCREARGIWDIGANIGHFGIMAALLRPDAQVYAFEPVPRVFKLLQKNKALNNVPNLEVVRAALTSRDGHINLYVPPGGTPTSASTLERFRRKKHPVAVSVKALRGDTFVRELGVECLDLIKIDTEATEPHVFRGMEESLRRFRPLIICEVLAGRTEADLMAILSPLGYSFWHITDCGLVRREAIVGDPDSRYNNYLFTPTETPPKGVAVVSA